MTSERKYITVGELDAIADKRKDEIRSSPDSLTISGNTYYVSNGGDDAADGRSPESAWRTLERVTKQSFHAVTACFSAAEISSAVASRRARA